MGTRKFRRGKRTQRRRSPGSIGRAVDPPGISNSGAASSPLPPGEVTQYRHTHTRIGNGRVFDRESIFHASGVRAAEQEKPKVIRWLTWLMELTAGFFH